MRWDRRDERGAASVEHAALVLLMALVACAVVAVFALTHLLLVTNLFALIGKK